LATEPTVLATWLAAHGSVAAVADGDDGTVSAAIAPPAQTANAANMLRRAVTRVGVIDYSLDLRTSGVSQTAAVGDERAPTWWRPG
jgi:hypothetical protein